MSRILLIIALLAFSLVPDQAHCSTLTLNEDLSLEIPRLTFGSNTYSFTDHLVPTPDDTDHYYWRPLKDVLQVTSARKNADTKPVF